MALLHKPSLEGLFSLMNKPTPKTYRTTNWSSYNRALMNRGNISIWFDPNTQWYAQPQGKQGRNQTYSDTAIQCCFNDQIFIQTLFTHGHRFCSKSN